MDRYSNSRNHQCLNMAISQDLMAVVVLSLIPILCKHHLGIAEVTRSCWALQVNSNFLKITISIFQFLQVSWPVFLQTVYSVISLEQGPFLCFCNNNEVICSVFIFTFPYLPKMMSQIVSCLNLVFAVPLKIILNSLSLQPCWVILELGSEFLIW